MRVEEALRRVRQRVSRSERTGRADAVLGPDAIADAAALADAAHLLSADQTPGVAEPQLTEIRRVLGLFHLLRFANTPSGRGDSDDLAWAIVCFAPLREDPTSIPEGLLRVLGPDPDAGTQIRTGDEFIRRGVTGALVLLDAGIMLLALAARPGRRTHATWVDAETRLTQAHRLRYERTGSPSDLRCAIGHGEHALRSTRKGDPDRPYLLHELAVVYRNRYDHSADPADLNRAISLSGRALLLIPEDDRRRGRYQSGVAGAYLRRYDRSKDVADLDHALRHGEAAAAATPQDDPELPGILFNLAITCRRRYDHGGDEADLARAIDIGEQVNAVAPREHGSRHMNLSSLGLAYVDRYERDGSLADLQRAIEVGEQAAEVIPAGHPARCRYLSNLVSPLLHRYRRLGELADLQRAVKTAEQAVAAAPDGHRDRQAGLHALSMAYGEHAVRTGTPEELDQAAELIRESLASRPDGYGRAGDFGNLCVIYGQRYQRGGSLADLERAIDAGEQAVAGTGGSPPDRAIRLHGLAYAYQARCERGGDASDLERAIDLYGQADACITTGYFGRVQTLSNRSGLHLMRYERTGASADLDQAMQLAQQALATAVGTQPVPGEALANLATGHLRRYQRDGNPDDLAQAIDLGEQSLAAMPDDHPARAQALAQLALSYLIRCEVSGVAIDTSRLAELAGQATSAATASPASRIHCCAAVGSLALASAAHHTARDLLDTAISLLPSVAPREGEWTDQEHQLGRYSGLISTGIAAHCATGDPPGAMEVAELGRGIVLASRLDSRSDLTDLENKAPELAARFRKVRSQLAAIDGNDGTRPLHVPNPIDLRRDLWAQHDDLLSQIRRIPGFARFLLPPRLPDLRAAATGGAVVLVNAAGDRCDAIINTASGEPQHVPLPALTLDDVHSRGVELLEATHAATGSQRILPDLLAWLWDTITGPVLAALPLAATQEQPVPRIWWLPTGMLSLFPLHAAGHPGRPGALDAAASSYIPTLRALASARGRPRPAVRRQLAVTLPHTPGLPDLPAAAAEADELCHQHPGTAVLRDQDATTSGVLTALHDATWAHFACHASTDLGAPSRSGLRLHDGTLPIPDISRLDLSQAELAYLSACSTASHGLWAADESIHLASAFQLIGFRHVIASLWPLGDDLAATAARSFYRRITVTGPAADQAAEILRQVTLELRDRHANRPDLWAPLIHSGP